jgi:Holliday junction resolvase RusA-like endonuclease
VEGVVSAKKRNHPTAGSDANVEPDSPDAALRANEAAYFTTPVRIHFHHIRKRLADLDGLSIKAVLDGLVAANVLAGDSPQCVAEISHTQSKGDPERTIITITEAP